MGKIVIASERYKRIKDEFNEFNINSEIEEDCGIICSYDKLNFSTENHYSNGKEWITGVGTFVYNSNIGEKALKEILDIFDIKRINEIRDKIYGNYCLVVAKNEKKYVFTDMMGGYIIYYSLLDQNKDIILTNTWYHIMKVLPGYDIDNVSVVQNICKSGIFGSNTPIKQIKRLLGSEILIFDQGWRKEVVDVSKVKNSVDFWEDIVKIYAEIGQVISRQGISYTGGLDSRLNLALTMAAGVRPHICIGVGNTRTTNTKEMDRLLARQTAEKFDLNFREMNWNNSDDKEMDKMTSILGEYSILYNANKNMYLENRNNKDVDCMLFGFNGEYLRNNDFVINDDYISIDQYIEKFFMTDILKETCLLYSDLKKRVNNEIIEICKYYSICIKEGMIHRDDVPKLTAFIKLNADARMCNYTNMFMYSYMLSPAIRLINYVNQEVPFNEKANAKYIIKGIKKIKPEVLELPIYSRHTLREIDFETNELKHKMNKIEMFRKKISRFYFKFQYTFIRRAYFVLKGDKKGYSEAKLECKNITTLKDKIKCSFLDDCFNSKKFLDYGETVLFEMTYLNLKLLNKVE